MSYGTPPIDIGDDVLVRVLDEQECEGERAWIESLVGARATSTRLWQLREASERFRDVVDAVPVPALPPMPVLPARRGSREAKAAIIALLLVAGSAAAMPGTRALATDASHMVVSWITGVTAVPVEPDVGSGRATVRFVPSGAAFTLTIESSQAAGSVVFVRSRGDEITARAASDAELVVLPGELLIRNHVESAEDMVVSVPAGVTDVRLRFGGGSRVISFERGRRVVIPLR